MRGATRRLIAFNIMNDISTHTPHARCDICRYFFKICNIYFYSHTSCEVRQKKERGVLKNGKFLLTHLMRGATWKHCTCYYFFFRFLLTHLMRGATIFPTHGGSSTIISTHTPHARCDLLF